MIVLTFEHLSATHSFVIGYSHVFNKVPAIVI